MAFTQLIHVPEQYLKTCHHHFLSQSLPLFKACSRQGINNRTWHTRKHQPWRPKSDLDERNCSRNKSSRRNRNSVASCCLSLRNMASSMPSDWNRCLKQSNNTILSTFHVWQRWSSCWPSGLPDPHNKHYSYITSMSDFTYLPCSSQKLPSAGGLWTFITLWLLSLYSIAIRPLECHPLSVSFSCIPCPSYLVWQSQDSSDVHCQIIKSVMSDEGAIQALSLYFPTQFCHCVKCCYLVLCNALLVFLKYTFMS